MMTIEHETPFSKRKPVKIRRGPAAVTLTNPKHVTDRVIRKTRTRMKRSQNIL